MKILETKSLKKYLKSLPIYHWLRNKYVYFELKWEREEIPILKQIKAFARTQKDKKFKDFSYHMRLGVAYNLFDGEELLEYSIKSIRKNVDFICVIWQKISNHGEPCSEEMEDFLNKLVRDGLVDKLYLYEPDIVNIGGDNARLNEIKKRNIGLELCRQNRCTHHMTIDTDEFYTDKQFRFMKKEMERGNYGTGYCRHVQYYHDSIYQFKYPERNYVSTIEKIMPNTKFVYNIPCVVVIDPTRKTNNVMEGGLTYRIFTRKECEMHHMSYVRKDFRKKTKSHSNRSDFSNESIEKIIECYESWKYPEKCIKAEGLSEVIEVPRQFEIYKVD